jgi:Tfp pilus assembly protein PilO
MTRRLALITGAAVVIVVLVFWFAAWSPTTGRLHAADARLTTAQIQETQLQGSVASLGAQSKKLPTYRAQLKSLDLLVPDAPALAAAIGDLDAIASSTGVTLQSLSPSAATSGAATSTGPPAITISLSVTGTYEQLTRFVRGIQSGVRLAVVDTVSISGGGAGPAGATAATGLAAAGQLTASISARIFFANATLAPQAAS